MLETFGTAALLDVPSGPLRIGSAPADGSEPVRLSVIVPTYNEAKNIGELVGRLCELLDPKFGAGYEIIVVDDDSPDRTWELAKGLGQRHPRVRPGAIIGLQYHCRVRCAGNAIYVNTFNSGLDIVPVCKSDGFAPGTGPVGELNCSATTQSSPAPRSSLET